MKRWILVIAFLLCLELALSKSSEKIHKKKNSSIKKKITTKTTTKLSNSHDAQPLEIFKELPPEDYAFVKELDKQFKLHGDKIKIKVERSNNTETSTGKNSKRTIDGDLGYGYNHNNHYHFSPPRYMIYPYSQNDIPPQKISHIHNFGRTEVSIEPSRAFEIKEVRNDYRNQFYRHQHPTQPGHETLQYQHHQQQQTYTAPVIVLRIPGPAKYASHLQALLQQYLEIRAAQYIKVFQDTEAHHAYHQSEESAEPERHYQPEENYHQQYVDVEPEQTPHAPHSYPPEHVYQQVKQHNVIQQRMQQQQHQHQHQHQQQYQHQQPQYELQPPTAEEQQPQQLEYTHQHQADYDESAPSGPSESYDAYGPPTAEAGSAELPHQYQYAQEPIYVTAPAAVQPIVPHKYYGPPQQHVASSTPAYLPPPPPPPPPVELLSGRKGTPTHSPHLQISENNPRSTHTKVIFTDGENNDHTTSYQLPVVKPAPQNFQPATSDQYNLNIQYDEDDHGHQHESYSNHYEHTSENADNSGVIAITQRPFNYHASRLGNKFTRSSTAVNNKKRDSPTPEEQFRKLNKLIDRLKKTNANGPENH